MHLVHACLSHTQPARAADQTGHPESTGGGERDQHLQESAHSPGVGHGSFRGWNPDRFPHLPLLHHPLPPTHQHCCGHHRDCGQLFSLCHDLHPRDNQLRLTNSSCTSAAAAAVHSCMFGTLASSSAVLVIVTYFWLHVLHNFLCFILILGVSFMSVPLSIHFATRYILT